jgi:ABC-2 type transport system permease protein
MTISIARILAVAGRSLSQIRQDHRFLGLSLLFPAIIIYFIYVVLNVLVSPFFDPSVYVIPYGAFLVHFITFIMTAIVVVRERTAGTLPRMFISGYTQVDVILGYLLSYTVLASIQSLIVLLELNWLFDLSYSFEKLAALYLVMWLLSAISLEIGIFVSNFARSEGQVIPFIPLILISMIISGVILPVEKLPEWVQVFSHVSPLYYANEIIQVLIAGGVLADAMNVVGQLTLFGLVVMALATLTLQERD